MHICLLNVEYIITSQIPGVVIYCYNMLFESNTYNVIISCLEKNLVTSIKLKMHILIGSAILLLETLSQNISLIIIK